MTVSRVFPFFYNYLRFEWTQPRDCSIRDIFWWFPRHGLNMRIDVRRFLSADGGEGTLLATLVCFFQHKIVRIISNCSNRRMIRGFSFLRVAVHCCKNRGVVSSWFWFPLR